MIVEKLKGVFLPVCTPFGPDEHVDEEAFVSNMTFYAESPVKGYLVLGSNGENKSLNFSEQVKVARLASENKGAHQCIMLGALYESERLVSEFVEAVGRDCMDFLTLLSPSYFRKQMTDELLYGYFSRLSDASPVPTLLYNAPGFTGVTLPTELVERLSGHGNIAGIKDSGKGDIERFFHLNSDTFSVLAGSVRFFLKGLQGGCSGGVASLGNAFPYEICVLYDAYIARDMKRAEAEQERLAEAGRCVSGRHGVAGVKKAMDWVGLKGGVPRRPLLPLDEFKGATLREELIRLGLLQ